MMFHMDCSNLENFFSSKSDVLKFLFHKLKKSTIEEMMFFSIYEWDKNKEKILCELSNNFPSELVIVRSSAMGEDSIQKSEAGNYLSIQNVNSSSKKQLEKSIQKVINSYHKKGNYNKNNQILIQKQSLDIITSGVIFSKSLNIGSPYYIINFDDGTNTDSVTKGEVGNIIKISRFSASVKIPLKWKKLIKSVQEIEKILGTDLLDIEFGINIHKEIIIFQVRPLTSTKSITIKNFNNHFPKLIETNKKYFSKLQKNPSLIGNRTIFSDMSDWNPAEIIGSNPNLLDYSLYDYLIMKNTWSKSREMLGYTKVKTNSLMVKFGQKPYVDVRSSFNSLIPAKIPKKLKSKLMAYYMNKIQNFPHLHDKIEFEILFSCYDPTIKNRLNELHKYNFSKEEIHQIDQLLKKFTGDLIDNFPSILNATLDAMRQLKENREKSLKSLIDVKSPSKILNTLEKLLNDCRNIGTLYFSIMARLAFVSSIILKGLEKNGNLDSKILENFMNTLQTPLSDIQHDLNSYVNGDLSRKQFLVKYGHLRPGTYDITASRYDKDKNFFNNVKYLKNEIDKISFNEFKFKKIFQKHIPFESEKFLFFIKESISQREKTKFEFTKNLSSVIELIAMLGKLYGFSREDVSNLSVDFILRNKNKNKNEIRKLWTKNILKEKNSKSLKNYLSLPPLLTHENDFDVHEHYISKPNFITSKKITADIYTIKNSKKFLDVENKIVLIENADPGYDWLFTKNISGLITKYGGVASHIAIRCAELGLPAAIGCGDILFEQLENTQKVLLDCKHHQIIILEKNTEDNYSEEKKLLKSLGYIK
ncbi:conserved hypothetical protein [Nitrosopumilus maritimus SCM1]|uniref:PEP-utilising enzyme mobile domain-containing protein n=2 Tax=Nitrosopumilus maritimus TaxID=338192 RepID=A9A3C7_NITMS|nr:conserved hypothetical protein [Nitrosopumilus maritimus SCM1]